MGICLEEGHPLDRIPRFETLTLGLLAEPDDFPPLPALTRQRCLLVIVAPAMFLRQKGSPNIFWDSVILKT
ncbi:MAG: hypothetical protein Fur0043_23960 [Anaerolineales bacterium]